MNESYEREIIIISFYTNLIQNILKDHEKLSVVKILVFCFLIKKQEITSKIYNDKNKKDVMQKFISQISGEFNHFVNDLDFLLKSIDILIKNSKIEYLNGTLKSSNFKIPKRNNNFIYNAINESKYYSDEQFMKEVLYYV